MRNNRTNLLLGVLVVALCSSLMLTVKSNNQLKNIISGQEMDLNQLERQQEKVTVDYKVAQDKLNQAKKDFFEDVAGFSVDTIEEDDQLVFDYLDKIFTWTTGDQYDKQREVIEQIGAEGTKQLLGELMVENYRVPVPEDLKGQIKDNDIDVNGIKSQLINYRFNRFSWEQTATADVTYIARITYQVYINEEDLSGDYKTTTDLLFTLKLSGIGNNRKITEVNYAFVQ